MSQNNPAVKPALLKGVTQTLTFRPTEGPPEASPTPTVSVFDENGDATSIVDSSATILNDTLTVSVSAAILDEEGDNYRAIWTYTVNGEEFTRQHLFECRLSVFYNPLDHVLFVSDYIDLLDNRMRKGQANYQPKIDIAFSVVMQWIRKAGRNPNMVVDPRAFTLCIAELTAYHVGRNRRFGSSDTDGTNAWARDMLNSAGTSFDDAMASVDWIDFNEDLLPGGDETNVIPRARIRH